MKPQRRRLIQLITAFSLGTIGAAAGVRAQPKGGEFPFHTLNPPQPVEAPAGKIEVIEFFWYGCPHCYAVEPAVEAWLKRLPADVVFRRVPPALGQSWVPHAQAFYAFEVLGVLPTVHRAFFDAIHRDRLQVGSWPAMKQWLERNRIAPAKYEEAVRSFSVENSVRKAARMGANYQVSGVPSFAIHGRYTVASGEVPEEQLVPAVEQLVALTRNELGFKAPSAPARTPTDASKQSAAKSAPKAPKKAPVEK